MAHIPGRRFQRSAKFVCEKTGIHPSAMDMDSRAKTNGTSRNRSSARMGHGSPFDGVESCLVGDTRRHGDKDETRVCYTACLRSRGGWVPLGNRMEVTSATFETVFTRSFGQFRAAVY